MEKKGISADTPWFLYILRIRTVMLSWRAPPSRVCLSVYLPVLLPYVYYSAERDEWVPPCAARLGACADVLLVHIIIMCVKYVSIRVQAWVDVDVLRYTTYYRYVDRPPDDLSRVPPGLSLRT
jgi:hypothetical protein